MNLFIEVCGWTSATLIVIHMIPQLLKVLKEKNSNGLSMSMLQMWFWAEVLAIIYGVGYEAWAFVASAIYSTILGGIFIYYKIKYSN